ncbi:MAG: hypothetical protein ACOX4W_02020 [Bacilli bacterium]|jgi:hypothetical protein
MEQVKTFMANLFDKANNVLKPIVDAVLGLFNGEHYVLYTLFGIWVAILIIIGLIAFVMKGTKPFILLVVLTAIVFAAWFFFVK